MMECDDGMWVETLCSDGWFCEDGGCVPPPMICTAGDYMPLEDELARINAITIDELRSVAEVWPVQPLVTGRMIPSRAAANAAEL